MNNGNYLEGLEVIKKVESEEYLLTVFKYGHKNKEAVLLIQKTTGDNFCELYREDGSLVGGILSQEAEILFELEENYEPIKNEDRTPRTPNWMLTSKEEKLDLELHRIMSNMDTDRKIFEKT